jgi:hypothetical protein
MAKWLAGKPEGILRWHAQRDSVGDADSEKSEEESESDAKVLASDMYPWRRGGWTDILKVVDYDDGFMENGYFLLVQSGGALIEEYDCRFSLNRAKNSFPAYDTKIVPPFRAKIVPYHEGSYYSSRDGINDRVVWIGDDRELFILVDEMRDPKMNERCLQKDDYDYAVWSALYEGIRVWRQNECPLWRGRKSRGCARPFWNSIKTPNATQVALYWKQVNDAATRIEAVFRGWLWRLRFLYNPYTDVGYKYLIRQWEPGLSGFS